MPVTVEFNFQTSSRAAVPRTLLIVSDGDTPQIQQPIRGVSYDTAEKAPYAGAPPTAQPKLDRCRTRLESGFFDALPSGLRTYLAAKLTANAAQRHIDAALRASQEFAGLMESRLTKPDGSKRKLAIIATGEIVDTYGRMLAYFAPWYANTASDPLPPWNSSLRATLNLNMIANGWGAFFPIYPSLMTNANFNLAIGAAENAWDNKQGQWAEFGSDLLLGYEYRMCVKLARDDGSSAAELIVDAFQRVCVDLREMTIVGKFGFASVPPPYRLWIWDREPELSQAKQDLGLIE